MNARVKGWCPGAWTPMRSGDGLILRIRPRLARLTRDEVLGLCDLSRRYAGGGIDLTNRANLQLRGVRDEDYQPLLDGLLALGLLDDTPEAEARRNVTVEPFWSEGDLTHRMATDLNARLAEFPLLPAKFGFAVDCGDSRVLSSAPADIRIERGAAGVIIRADGLDRGRAVDEDTAIDTCLDLARWFATHRGEARRMRPISTSLGPEWQEAEPAPEAMKAHGGTLLGAPFGHMNAASLADLTRKSECEDIRVTHYRSIYFPNHPHISHPDFLSDLDNPILNAHACPGAPACAEATVETRALAAALAPRTQGTLHVSGCAKGCALPRRADVTLTGRDGRFDLVQNGHPWDEPARRGLDPHALKTGTESL
ncbi:MAG: cobalamin biosynthesis protein CobG [Pseudooceanicola nanhaiensis]